MEFFKARLGDRLPEMAATFEPLRESILQIARDEDLWSDKASRGRASGRYRRQIVREYWGVVRSSEADATSIADVVSDLPEDF